MISQRVLVQVLDAIDYKPHVMSGFVYGHLAGGFYIQHWQVIPDCNHPDELAERQKGRKWYISRHMSFSELVQTCFMAVKAFEEHEARECFKFRGTVPFGPHIDIAALQTASTYKETRSG